MFGLVGWRSVIACGLVISSLWGTAVAQTEDWGRMRSIRPRGYVCAFTATPAIIDGKLDDAVWRTAAWTDEFVDIEGDAKPRPNFRTRAKMAWDDEFFYIAAELQEPHVWGTLTEHDAVIFQDNDFEVFIDPDGDHHEYAELELNVLNTTWDLFLPKPYKDGGQADNGFEMRGLKTAVHCNGTINDPTDQDSSWSVELAIPWTSLAGVASGGTAPQAGDQWRVNFSRVQWQHAIVDGEYRKVPGTREDNWVWSPQGIIDMHRPERWGFVQFSKAAPGAETFRPAANLAARERLIGLYHHQKSFQKTHGRWATGLAELGIDAADDGATRGLTLRPTATGFQASVLVPDSTGELSRWCIDEASRFFRSPLDADVSAALQRAGDNREQLQRALAEAPLGRREGLEFLIAHMPDRDLTNLSAEFLLENLRLAFDAWDRAAWRDQLPWEIFANEVLPYASINERRDAWREQFQERFEPLIREAKSLSQAAAILNQKIFPLVNVRYSTQRPRADQSPLESIQAGLASCTGLSVLLIDACRAVGIPARFVGTPRWADNSGNHSWVEVWDDGWHFTGAAEPAGDLLDQAWFTGRARTAVRDDPRHAIYAVSYRRTPLKFPMVWAAHVDDVWAVNVTDRYQLAGPAPPADSAILRFSARLRGEQERVAATVTVRNAAGEQVFAGVTKDERFDTNDLLEAYLPAGQEYRVEFRHAGEGHTTTLRAEPQPMRVVWTLPQPPVDRPEPADRAESADN